MRERGASGLEYIGAVVLVGLLVGAVIFGVLGTDNKIGVAVCKAVNSILQSDGACGPATGPTDADKNYEPDKCKYNEKGEKYNSKIKVFFIEFGENAGMVVTEYSDGTVEMTATDGGSIGATGGFGADASFGKLSAGAKVDFGAGLKFDYGSTWKFDNMDDAQKFKKGLNDYLAQEIAMQHGGYCLWWCKDAPRQPDTTVSSISVYGDVKGTLGLSLTSSSGSGSQTQTASIPAAELVGKIGGDSKWAVTTNASAGTTTYTTQLSINSSVAGQLWTSTFGTKGTGTVAMKITKDKNGNVTNVTFVSTTEGGISTGGKAGGKGSSGTGDGKTSGGGSIGVSEDATRATVVTSSLDIDPKDSAQQQTVSDWLGGDSNYSWSGAIAAGNIDPSRANQSDPFQQLMHDQGKVSAVTYDNITDTESFGLNVKIGFALGFDFSLEQSQSQAVDASYLGAPDASGTRQPVPYTDCVG